MGAVGAQPLFYRWQRNGTPLSDGGNISGSATSALTLQSVSLADAGTYMATVGNGDGLASSTGAVLSVTSITAPATSLGTVYSFTGSGDGANPNGLLRHANGSFYGTTQNGGTDFSGTVFRLPPAEPSRPSTPSPAGDTAPLPLQRWHKGRMGTFTARPMRAGP